MMFLLTYFGETCSLDVKVRYWEEGGKGDRGAKGEALVSGFRICMYVLSYLFIFC
jgi:hypothetical protein